MLRTSFPTHSVWHPKVYPVELVIGFLQSPQLSGVFIVASFWFHRVIIPNRQAG
jgi:hypothetical protein